MSLRGLCLIRVKYVRMLNPDLVVFCAFSGPLLHYFQALIYLFKHQTWIYLECVLPGETHSVHNDCLQILEEREAKSQRSCVLIALYTVQLPCSVPGLVSLCKNADMRMAEPFWVAGWCKCSYFSMLTN